MIDAHDLIVDYWDDVYPHAEYCKRNDNIRKRVMAEFHGLSNIKILDLCCGTGRGLSLFLQERNIDKPVKSRISSSS